MRLKSITATALLSACLLPLLFAAAPVGAEEIQLQENRPDQLHRAEGRHALGHLGQVSQAAMALARHLAHESRPDQESALDLPGRRRLARQGRRRVATVGRQRGARRSATCACRRRSGSTRFRPRPFPSIPAGDLTPYLTQPIITGPDGLPGAAKIIAARDNRVVRGEGDSVYAISIDEKPGTEWVIYRPGNVLRSYDSNETSRLRNALPGHRARRALRRGQPHADHHGARGNPDQRPAGAGAARNAHQLRAARARPAVDGRIIELYNAGTEAGRGFIVVLDRGARDGLEVGNVLAIYHPSPVIADPRPYEGPDVLSRLSDATRSRSFHRPSS